MKQTIEFTAPKGFAVAEGEQPRRAAFDDYLFVAGEAHHYKGTNPSSHEYIILRKETPAYATVIRITGNESYLTSPDAPPGLYVEKRALEDALSLIGLTLMSFEDGQMLEELKELIK